MPALLASGRHDLGDDEWSVLEHLLPAGKKAGRPPKWTKRQLIDGIRWRVRAGAPWRDVPPEYGPWQSAYGLFRRWQLDGTWAFLVAALQVLADAAGHVTWDVSVDSGTARAHQHAGRPRAGPVPRGPDQQVPPRRRAGAEAPGGHRDRRPARGQPAVHPRAGEDQRSPPRRGQAPDQARTGSWPTRPTAARPTAPGCAAAGSPAPSPRRKTRSRTGRRRAAQEDAGPPSTRRNTNSATPWNAGSTGSSATAPSPPAMTSSPSDTRRHST